MRAQQREATREQIVVAALVAMSEMGFEGASTRAIAERAGVSQGLLTYHFKSKDLLWRAAADHIFTTQREWMERVRQPSEGGDRRGAQRAFIREFVKFHAAHPEFMRFLMDNDSKDSARLQWLVDTHLRSAYQVLCDVMVDTPKDDMPHMFYALAGAGGIMFNAPNECEQITGIDPRSEAAIARHADYLVNLMIPE